MLKYLCFYICFVILLLFFLASLFLSFFFLPENRCEMTYMFKYPEFLNIELSSSIQKQFPNYKTSVYTEGYDEPVRRNTFQGIPVLFVPGNDGSHKQVRSAASVSLQMYKSRRTSFLFDYFAVDFNGEMSALYGPFLYRQSDYLSHVVKHILSLYEGSRHSQLILIGHSMGGLLARHLVTRNDVDSRSIRLILSLATPHQAPVLNSDPVMNRFYEELNLYWTNNKATKLGHIPVISIAGGERDIEVAVELTKLDDLVLPKNSLWLPASSVRHTWASTDHRCIVWCKQLVLATVRSLFDAASDRYFLNPIRHFQRHLLPAQPSNDPIDTHSTILTPAISSNIRWIEKDLRSDTRFTIERDSLLGRIFIKLNSLSAIGPSSSVVMVLDGSLPADWLFVCADDNCTRLVSVTHRFSWDFPPTGINRKLAIFTQDNLKKNNDVVQDQLILQVGPGKDLVEFMLHLTSDTAVVPSLNLFGALLPLKSSSLIHTFSLWVPTDGLVMNLYCTGCVSRAGATGAIVQHLESVKYNETGNLGFQKDGWYHSIIQHFHQNASLYLRSCGFSKKCNIYVLTNPDCNYAVSLSFNPLSLGAQALRYNSTHVVIYGCIIAVAALLYQLRNPKTLTLFCVASSYVGLNCSVILAIHFLYHSYSELVNSLLHLLFSFSVLTLLIFVINVVVFILSFCLRVLTFGASGTFMNLFVSILSPVSSALALYMWQNYSSSAAGVFLLLAQLIKTAVCRIRHCAAPNSDSLIRIYRQQCTVSLLMALLSFLMGPSLIVWIKGLIATEFQQSWLLTLDDPYHMVGMWISLLCAVNTGSVSPDEICHNSLQWLTLLAIRLFSIALPLVVCLVTHYYTDDFYNAALLLLSVLAVVLLRNFVRGNSSNAATTKSHSE